MTSEVTFRCELEIPALKVLHYLRDYNQKTEDDIQAGIEAAFAKLDIKQIVEEGIAKNLRNIVASSFSTWALEKEIKEKMAATISKKVSEYTDQIGQILSKQLNIEIL